jgi:hypothetical protein
VKLLPFRSLLVAPVLALVSPVAGATELTWDGHYRARGQFFDSLSLSNSALELAPEDAELEPEGVAMSFDHRFRLQPNWLLSEHASLHAQLDLLPFLEFGDQPETIIDPVSGDPLPVELGDAVVPPTTDEGGTTTQNLQVTRAWGEVTSSIGTLALGRMPVSWGAGMVWNDGNEALDEYGDTADRLQLTSLIGPVYVMGAFETNYEHFVAESDDVSTVSASFAYRTETAGIGMYNTLRYWTAGPQSKYRAYTGDLWGRAAMGPVTVETELATVLGSGDLGDANDIRISAFGGFLSVGLDNDKVIVNVTGGFATGDSEPDDDVLKTFTFDRDFNMALILFEENLPTLEASVMNEENGGRDYSYTRTGNAMRNLLFAKPTVGYHFLPELQGTVSMFASQAAKLDEEQTEDGMKGYGLEFDAAVRYDPFPHAWFQLRGGYWMPGRYFSLDPQSAGEDDKYGFERPVTAVELVGVVEF